jgi:hypothetical protein
MNCEDVQLMRRIPAQNNCYGIGELLVKSGICTMDTSRLFDNVKKSGLNFILLTTKHNRSCRSPCTRQIFRYQAHVLRKRIISPHCGYASLTNLQCIRIPFPGYKAYICNMPGKSPYNNSGNRPFSAIGAASLACNFSPYSTEGNFFPTFKDFHK